MQHFNATKDERYIELFADKPEMVIDFPEWLLSDRMIEECRAMPGLAIVEIAGRDSVAAAIKSVNEQSFTDLLPVYVYTGTEYGPWSSVEKAVERLASNLPMVRVHRLLVLGSPGFWKALNGRFVSQLISTYKFYTPCVACHLYLHAVRIPLALNLGKVPIISGEREQHDGVIKINQISAALDFFIRLADKFEIQLLFPLRHISKGLLIEDLLGFNWPEGKEQLECILSGNYRLSGKRLNISASQVKGFLDEFAGPCTEKIVTSYVEGHIPDHLEIAAQILANRR
ncbi:hypothetical protein ACFL03_07745 [Thermodesulfobacteriota bacterium]